MDNDRIYKTVRQYSKPLPPTTMEALREVSDGFAAAKSYVYHRYGGIGGIKKIYSAYTVQNELAKTGIREELGMPTVYFGLAMFSALSDIKSMWSNLKRKIVRLIQQNVKLTDTERHYLYTVLKQDVLFAKILNREECRPSANFRKIPLDYRRLHNLLCRLTRRHMVKLAPPKNRDYFETYRRAYAYKEGGIAMATKIPYKRVFIPLTDNCRYSCQIRVHLLTDRIVLSVPVEVHTKSHEDYKGRIGLHLGYSVMATTSSGNRYGEQLGTLFSEETRRLTCVLASRNRLMGRYRIYRGDGDNKRADRILHNNLGKKKYEAQRQRNDVRIKSYINAELNRLIQTEKPAAIYASKMSNRFSSFPRPMRQKFSRWQVGYILRRLEFKCRLHRIEFNFVNPSYISSVCAVCGGTGEKRGEYFYCTVCGVDTDYGVNGAKNLLRKVDGIFLVPDSRV